jgi:hypothetical protein
MSPWGAFSSDASSIKGNSQAGSKQLMVLRIGGWRPVCQHLERVPGTPIYRMPFLRRRVAAPARLGLTKRAPQGFSCFWRRMVLPLGTAASGNLGNLFLAPRGTIRETKRVIKGVRVITRTTSRACRDVRLLACSGHRLCTQEILALVALENLAALTTQRDAYSVATLDVDGLRQIQLEAQGT